MENKVIIQDEVIEVTMLKETGRMLDIFGVRIRKAEDGEPADRIVAKTLNY